MAFSLAVAGKGGIGKTSIAALLIHSLVERANGTVECFGARLPKGATTWGERELLAVPLNTAEIVDLRTLTLVAHEWSTDLEASLAEVSFQ